MQTSRVIVVGGGSTGASILYQLAKRGETDAILLEMGSQAGAGQTSRSTALVRTHYSIEVLVRMALSSYRFFKNFENEVPGYSAGYVETGLLVGADERSVAGLHNNLDMYRKLGIESRILDRDEAGQIEPMLDTTAFTAVVYEPKAGYAEPSAVASSFASAAKTMGAKAMTDTRVTSISRSPDGYSVSTTRGTFRCREVVLATGTWSKPLFEAMKIPLPLKIVRHPVAVLGRPTEYRGARPVIFDFPRSAYYKPEGLTLLCVGSLALELDASSAEADPEHYDQGITYEEIADFSSSVAKALPVMATQGVYERGYAGLYDNTPDQQPVIDELSEYGFPGVYCVVGLSGHGFKLAPEFGRIVAALITDGKFSDYDVSAFRLKRFEEGRLMRGRYPVSTIG